MYSLSMQPRSISCFDLTFEKKSSEDYDITEKQEGTDQITGMTLIPRSSIN